MSKIKPERALFVFNFKKCFVIRKDDLIIMKGVALCFKPYLKPEEAYIYCNLGHTQFAKKCEEFGIVKNDSGYYRREDLHKIMNGAPSLHKTAVKT
ncbi:hypothetical protein A8C56_12580 [Niabella ginsenosidivorans]|uniref:Uncharacterized protein n=1 Tax=Niabella ginsenosidivorans TaxID=1176587 RepID=A0A1A9I3S8_9BACT|nr:hypothetical protein A8C56_12580 [Niabella ginsenosidivorans]